MSYDKAHAVTAVLWRNTCTAQEYKYVYIIRMKSYIHFHTINETLRANSLWLPLIITVLHDAVNDNL